jgi:hypothetical protein
MGRFDSFLQRPPFLDTQSLLSNVPVANLPGEYQGFVLSPQDVLYRENERKAANQGVLEKIGNTAINTVFNGVAGLILGIPIAAEAVSNFTSSLDDPTKAQINNSANLYDHWKENFQKFMGTEIHRSADEGMLSKLGHTVLAGIGSGVEFLIPAGGWAKGLSLLGAGSKLATLGTTGLSSFYEAGLNTHEKSKALDKQFLEQQRDYAIANGQSLVEAENYAKRAIANAAYQEDKNKVLQSVFVSSVLANFLDYAPISRMVSSPSSQFTERFRQIGLLGQTLKQAKRIGIQGASEVFEELTPELTGKAVQETTDFFKTRNLAGDIKGNYAERLWSQFWDEDTLYTAVGGAFGGMAVGAGSMIPNARKDFKDFAKAREYWKTKEPENYDLYERTASYLDTQEKYLEAMDRGDIETAERIKETANKDFLYDLAANGRGYKAKDTFTRLSEGKFVESDRIDYGSEKAQSDNDLWDQEKNIIKDRAKESLDLYNHVANAIESKKGLIYEYTGNKEVQDLIKSDVLDQASLQFLGSKILETSADITEKIKYFNLPKTETIISSKLEEMGNNFRDAAFLSDLVKSAPNLYSKLEILNLPNQKIEEEISLKSGIPGIRLSKETIKDLDLLRNYINAVNVVPLYKQIQELKHRNDLNKVEYEKLLSDYATSSKSLPEKIKDVVDLQEKAKKQKQEAKRDQKEAKRKAKQEAKQQTRQKQQQEKQKQQFTEATSTEQGSTKPTATVESTPTVTDTSEQKVQEFQNVPTKTTVSGSKEPPIVEKPIEEVLKERTNPLEDVKSSIIRALTEDSAGVYENISDLIKEQIVNKISGVNPGYAKLAEQIAKVFTHLKKTDHTVLPQVRFSKDTKTFSYTPKDNTIEIRDPGYIKDHNQLNKYLGSLLEEAIHYLTSQGSPVINATGESGKQAINKLHRELEEYRLIYLQYLNKLADNGNITVNGKIIGVDEVSTIVENLSKGYFKKYTDLKATVLDKEFTVFDVFYPLVDTNEFLAYTVSRNSQNYHLLDNITINKVNKTKETLWDRLVESLTEALTTILQSFGLPKKGTLTVKDILNLYFDTYSTSKYDSDEFKTKAENLSKLTETLVSLGDEYKDLVQLDAEGKFRFEGIEIKRAESFTEVINQTIADTDNYQEQLLQGDDFPNFEVTEGDYPNYDPMDYGISPEIIGTAVGRSFNEVVQTTPEVTTQPRLPSKSATFAYNIFKLDRGNSIKSYMMNNSHVLQYGENLFTKDFIKDNTFDEMFGIISQRGANVKNSKKALGDSFIDTYKKPYEELTDAVVNLVDKLLTTRLPKLSAEEFAVLLRGVDEVTGATSLDGKLDTNVTIVPFNLTFIDGTSIVAFASLAKIGETVLPIGVDTRGKNEFSISEKDFDQLLGVLYRVVNPTKDQKYRDQYANFVENIHEWERGQQRVKDQILEASKDGLVQYKLRVPKSPVEAFKTSMRVSFNSISDLLGESIHFGFKSDIGELFILGENTSIDVPLDHYIEEKPGQAGSKVLLLDAPAIYGKAAPIAYFLDYNRFKFIDGDTDRAITATTTGDPNTLSLYEVYSDKYKDQLNQLPLSEYENIFNQTSLKGKPNLADTNRLGHISYFKNPSCRLDFDIDRPVYYFAKDANDNLIIKSAPLDVVLKNILAPIQIPYSPSLYDDSLSSGINPNKKLIPLKPMFAIDPNEVKVIPYNTAKTEITTSIVTEDVDTVTPTEKPTVTLTKEEYPGTFLVIDILSGAHTIEDLTEDDEEGDVWETEIEDISDSVNTDKARTEVVKLSKTAWFLLHNLPNLFFDQFDPKLRSPLLDYNDVQSYFKKLIKENNFNPEKVVTVLKNNSLSHIAVSFNTVLNQVDERYRNNAYGKLISELCNFFNRTVIDYTLLEEKQDGTIAVLNAADTDIKNEGIRQITTNIKTLSEQSKEELRKALTSSDFANIPVVEEVLNFHPELHSGKDAMVKALEKARIDNVKKAIRNILKGETSNSILGTYAISYQKILPFVSKSTVRFGDDGTLSVIVYNNRLLSGGIKSDYDFTEEQYDKLKDLIPRSPKIGYLLGIETLNSEIPYRSFSPKQRHEAGLFMYLDIFSIRRINKEADLRNSFYVQPLTFEAKRTKPILGVPVAYSISDLNEGLIGTVIPEVNRIRKVKSIQTIYENNGKTEDHSGEYPRNFKARETFIANSYLMEDYPDLANDLIDNGVTDTNREQLIKAVQQNVMLDAIYAYQNYLSDIDINKHLHPDLHKYPGQFRLEDLKAEVVRIIGELVASAKITKQEADKLVTNPNIPYMYHYMANARRGITIMDIHKGDPAFATKTNKDGSANIEKTTNEIAKRNSGSISPGLYTLETESFVRFINDQQINSRLPELYTRSKDKTDSKYKYKFLVIRDVTADSLPVDSEEYTYASLQTQHTIDILIDEGKFTEKDRDRLTKEIMKTSLTDAAGYVTPEGYLLSLVSKGLIGTEDAKDLYLLDKTGDYNRLYEKLNELGISFSVIKPIVDTGVSINGVDERIYCKNSESCLWRSQFPDTSSLGKLRNSLLSNGVIRASYDTAVKVGLVDNSVYSMEELLSDNFITRPISGVYEINVTDYAITSDAPIKQKSKVTESIQLGTITWESITEPTINIPGQSGLKSDVVKSNFQLLRGLLTKNIYNKVVNNISTEGVVDESKVKDFLLNKLKDKENPHIADSVGSNIPLAFTVYPTWVSTALTGVLRKLRIKLPGFSGIQVPCYKALENANVTWVDGKPRSILAYKRVLYKNAQGEWFYGKPKQDKSNLIDKSSPYFSNYWTQDKFGVEEGEFTKFTCPPQIVVPPYIKDTEGNIIDVQSLLLDRDSNNDNLVNELFQLYGYRIPVGSTAFATVFEVVGFTPPTLNTQVYVPYELALFMGADYDVDKLYFYGNNTYNLDRNSGGIVSPVHELAKLGLSLDDSLLNNYLNMATQANLGSWFKALQKENDPDYVEYLRIHEVLKTPGVAEALLLQYYIASTMLDNKVSRQFIMSNTETFKSIVNDIYKPDERLKSLGYGTISRQIELGYQNDGGQKLVGPSALYSSALYKLQSLDKGSTLPDGRKLKIANISNENTRLLIQTLLDFALDNAKDPYLAKANINEHTIRMALYLASLDLKPVGIITYKDHLKFIVDFLNTPTAKEYSRIMYQKQAVGENKFNNSTVGIEYGKKLAAINNIAKSSNNKDFNYFYVGNLSTNFIPSKDEYEMSFQHIIKASAELFQEITLANAIDKSELGVNIADAKQRLDKSVSSKDLLATTHGGIAKDSQNNLINFIAGNILQYFGEQGTIYSSLPVGQHIGNKLSQTEISYIGVNALYFELSRIASENMGKPHYDIYSGCLNKLQEYKNLTKGLLSDNLGLSKEGSYQLHLIHMFLSKFSKVTTSKKGVSNLSLMARGDTDEYVMRKLWDTYRLVVSDAPIEGVSDSFRTELRNYFKALLISAYSQELVTVSPTNPVKYFPTDAVYEILNLGNIFDNKEQTKAKVQALLTKDVLDQLFTKYLSNRVLTPNSFPESTSKTEAPKEYTKKKVFENAIELSPEEVRYNSPDGEGVIDPNDTPISQSTFDFSDVFNIPDTFDFTNLFHTSDTQDSPYNFSAEEIIDSFKVQSFQDLTSEFGELGEKAPEYRRKYLTALKNIEPTYKRYVEEVKSVEQTLSTTTDVQAREDLEYLLADLIKKKDYYLTRVTAIKASIKALDASKANELMFSTLKTTTDISRLSDSFYNNTVEQTPEYLSHLHTTIIIHTELLDDHIEYLDGQIKNPDSSEKRKKKANELISLFQQRKLEANKLLGKIEEKQNTVLKSDLKQEFFKHSSNILVEDFDREFAVAKNANLWFLTKKSLGIQAFGHPILQGMYNSWNKLQTKARANIIDFITQFKPLVEQYENQFGFDYSDFWETDSNGNRTGNLVANETPEYRNFIDLERSKFFDKYKSATSEEEKTLTRQLYNLYIILTHDIYFGDNSDIEYQKSYETQQEKYLLDYSVELESLKQMLEFGEIDETQYNDAVAMAQSANPDINIEKANKIKQALANYPNADKLMSLVSTPGGWQTMESSPENLKEFANFLTYLKAYEIYNFNVNSKYLVLKPIDTAFKFLPNGAVNAAYGRIMQDPIKSVFYTNFINKLYEIKRYLGRDTKSGKYGQNALFIPELPLSTVTNIRNLNLGALKGSIEEWFRDLHAISPRVYDANGAIDPETGKPYSGVQTYMLSGSMPENIKSTNLSDILIAFTAAGELYKAKSTAEPILRMCKNVFSTKVDPKSGITAKLSPIWDVVENYYDAIVQDDRQDKTIFTPEELANKKIYYTETEKKVIAEIDKEIAELKQGNIDIDKQIEEVFKKLSDPTITGYQVITFGSQKAALQSKRKANQDRINRLELQKTSYGKVHDWNQTVGGFITLVQLKVLGFSGVTALADFVQNFTSAIIHFSAHPKDIKYYMSGWKTTLDELVTGYGASSPKLHTLNKMFGVEQEFGDITKTVDLSLRRDALETYAGQGAFGFLKFSDKLNKYPVLISLMKQMHVETTEGYKLIVNGNPITYWDTIDDEGNILYDNVDYSWVSKKYKDIVWRNFGDYDSQNPLLFQRNAFSRALYMFKRWMPAAILARFGVYRANYLTGNYVKGRYISLFTPDGDAFLQDGMSGLFDHWKNVLMTVVYDSALADAVGIQKDSKLSAVDRDNVFRCIGEAGIILSATLALQILKSLVSDDDDERKDQWYLNAPINTITRLHQELYMFNIGLPWSITKASTYEQILPLVKTLKDINSLFVYTVAEALQEDEDKLRFQSGPKKDRRKSLYYLNNIFPILSQYNSVRNYLAPQKRETITEYLNDEWFSDDNKD